MKKLPFTTLRESKSFLKYFSKELNDFLGRDLATDVGINCDDLKYTIKIKFFDGSKIKFYDSFYVLKEFPKTEESEDMDSEDLYAIFTEHFGYFMFYACEIESIKMKKRK